VPVAVWRMFTAASWPERMSWLAWIWAGYLTAGLLRRFATRRTPRILIADGETVNRSYKSVHMSH